MGELSIHCIYTMQHSRKLHEQATTGDSHSLIERKAWVTGHRLWFEATKAEQPMALVFSAAEASSGLIYWALIQDITVDEGTTTCRYDDLRPIEPPRPLSDLRLRSSGRPMSENYIRPYAICETPDFIRSAATASK